MPGRASESAQVRAYIAALPVDTRREFKKLRSAIRSALPGGVDAYSYRIPAIRMGGKLVLWYAGFKRHTSMFPGAEVIRRARNDALKGYTISKGTVQFPLDKPIPVALVKRLARARLADMKPGGR